MVIPPTVMDTLVKVGISVKGAVENGELVNGEWLIRRRPLSLTIRKLVLSLSKYSTIQQLIILFYPNLFETNPLKNRLLGAIRQLVRIERRKSPPHSQLIVWPR